MMAVSAIRPQQTAMLVAAVATYGLLGSAHEFPAEPLPDAEFETLFDQCLTQRLTGALVKCIASGRLPATEAQAERASEAHFVALCHCLELESMLLQVVELFDAAGVEHRVLKGSATAHLDYADPAQRTFADVDLLVRSEDFDKTTALLVRHGYQRPVAEIRPGFDRRFGKGCTLTSESGYELDLHRTFVTGPFGLLVRLGDLWADATPWMLAGRRPLYALGREQRLLHACYHAALGDREPRIVPQRDIAGLVLSDDLDEVRVRELAYAWRAEYVVARAISMTWQTLALADETALTAWAKRYQPDQRSERAFASYRAEQANYAARSWASLRALPNLRTRASFMYSLAFPAGGVIGGKPLPLMRRLMRARQGLRADH
jgi:hypothetical protein